MPDGTKLLTLAVQANAFRAGGAVFWCFTPEESRAKHGSKFLKSAEQLLGRRKIWIHG